MARHWASCLRPHDAHPRDYLRLGYYRQAAPSRKSGSLAMLLAMRGCLYFFRGPLFIRVGRKQQRTDGIPQADDFAQSKVIDSLLVGFLGSLETHCNSEDMPGVVHGFPKLDFEGRPHFCSIRHKPHLGRLVLFRRGVFCSVPFV
jgi:hypothetical protein